MGPRRAVALAPYADAPLPDDRDRRDGHRTTAVHVGHERRAEGVHPLAGSTVPQQLDHVGEHGPQRRRHPLHDDAAVPLERDHHRVLSVDHHAAAPPLLRRKFSASGFLPDVRKYGVTYFNYVGKPLSYILATPEQPDDADNTLRIAFGNEAADLDIERFGDALRLRRRRRLRLHRRRRAHHPQPRDAEGRARDAGRGHRRSSTPRRWRSARARGSTPTVGCSIPTSASARSSTRTARPGFEGYYKNDEANAARIRNGWYWTGDLGYRDEDGWAYFGGRDFEWMRVDGENFAAAPIERILARHHDVVLAAVYAVPDAEVGDQVMATLLVRPGTAVRRRGVRRVPRRADRPRHEVVAAVRAHHRGHAGDREPEAVEAPAAARALGHRRAACSGGRPRARRCRPMTDADRDALHADFERRGRLAALDAG